MIGRVSAALSFRWFRISGWFARIGCRVVSGILKQVLAQCRGLFASADIVTLGRTALAGGCLLGLGLRALDENWAVAHSLLMFVTNISCRTLL